VKQLWFAMLLLSAPAWAEWTLVGGGDEFKVYVDKATIVEAANTVQMWALVDYATAQQWSDYLTYRSLKTQKEFDCEGAQQHTLTSLFHREPMASRESVFTLPGGTSWRPVAPDSIDQVLWEFACKK
jgi:Surface-adhesin protein E